MTGQTDPFAFLEQLAANNNRPWFEEHRGQYEEVRQWWLDRLDRTIAAMSTWYPEIAMTTGRDSAYRIYRDTRFSPDKTPYKTYLSAALSHEGRKSRHAGYYLQLDLRPDESGVYGGVWCPDRPVLNKLRRAIVDNIEEFEEIVNAPAMRLVFPGWCGSALKTVPKGWAREHPQAWILRRQDIGKFHMLDRTFWLSETWPEEVAAMMHILKPLIDFLNYSIDEEV